MKNGIVAESRLVSALNACRSRLKAFIRGRTPLRDEADDILQEVTYQLIRVEQPVENIAAWLFRAARNEMTDRARKKRELPLAGGFSEEEEGDFPEDELAETLFGVPQTPEDEYLKALLWEELNQALSELPPAQREAFEKTELQGKSGAKNKVSCVPVSMPPMTAALVSRWLEAHAPVESTRGITPTTNASEVITMGRRRAL